MFSQRFSGVVFHKHYKLLRDFGHSLGAIIEGWWLSFVYFVLSLKGLCTLEPEAAQDSW